MKNILESLQFQLQSEEEHLLYLKERMASDIDSNDFDHLCRISSEANESKGKIEILKRTILQIKRIN